MDLLKYDFNQASPVTYKLTSQLISFKANLLLAYFSTGFFMGFIRPIINSGLDNVVSSSAFQRFFRTIELPERLADVTSIDHKSEVPAHATGLLPETVESIWTAVENLYSTAYYPAIHFCLRHKGKVLLNRAIGHASGNCPGDGPDVDKVLVTPETPICLYSSSKAVTAALVHKAAEQGHLNLLDPISHYIPEFGAHGKDRTTIYQLLCHRAGIPGVKAGTPVEVIYDHQACLKLLCEAESTDQHGRKQAYHAVTGGFILRELIERATGMDMRQYWNKTFKTPMGFKVFDFGATDAVFESMSRDAATGARLPGLLDKYVENVLGGGFDQVLEVITDRRFFIDPIPSANMVATAEEVSRFYQMLLDLGKYKRRRIMDPLTVDHLTWETGPHKFDNQLKLPMRFTPGMMMGGSPIGIFGRNSSNAFGHLGLLNILTWADPDRDISVALLTSGKPILAHNLPSLLRLVSKVTSIPATRSKST